MAQDNCGGILASVRLTRLLFALFLITPILEIVVFFLVGRQIGLGATVAIIIVTAVIGAALVSRQGRDQLDRVRAEFASGLFPAKELAHGAMILFAGALLLTPGFITDAVGFALLVPTIRETLRRWLVRRYGRGYLEIS